MLPSCVDIGRRLWIFPEATLAPKNTAYLGSLQLDLLSIIRAIVWWDLKTSNSTWTRQKHRRRTDEQQEIETSRDASSTAGLACAYALWGYKDRDQSPWAREAKQLRHLLVVASQFDSTEPKDSVFALVGLLSQRLPSTLRPDYAKSLADILQAATRYAIAESSGLWILEYIHHRSDGMEDGAVATWAYRVDKSHTKSRSFFQQLPDIFHASDGLEQPSIVDQSPVRSSVLSLEGLEVDTIADATCTAVVFADVDECCLWLMDAMTVYTNTAKQRHVIPSVRSLARTLVVSSTNTNGSAQETRIDSVEKLLGVLPANGRTLADENEEQRGFRDSAFRNMWQECNLEYTVERRLFVTEAGRVGLAPDAARSGDVVVVLRGASVPFLLRPVDGEQYQLVGQAYVDEIMYGEAVKDCRASGRSERVFALR